MSETITHDQFIRRASLILQGGEVTFNFDESFSFSFQTTQAEPKIYPTAHIRIRNLSRERVSTILGKRGGFEYTAVTLQAGYVPPGKFGVIFKGTAVQFSAGKENATDTFLDIFAVSGDGLNTGLISQTLEGPVDQGRIASALNQSDQQNGVTPLANPLPSVGGVIPRGKTMWGTSTQYWRDLGRTRLSSFVVINGVMTEVPMSGYLPGDIVVINSQTGLIGQPVQTQQGISFTCLLNPALSIGRRVRLNNNEINSTLITKPGHELLNPKNTATAPYASESSDGLYRLAVVEFVGETRGNEWYANCVCLSIDPSAPADNSVKIFTGDANNLTDQ